MEEKMVLEKEDGIAMVWFDAKSAKLNLLDKTFLEEFTLILEDIEADERLKGVVFASRKESNFIAGADLHLILGCVREEEAEEVSQLTQEVFERLAKLEKATVAAIHGKCLGGGCELALACDYRIATTDPSTGIGLPEVKLGLIPGGGGTQRLPALIGLKESLDLLLEGKELNAKEALNLGVVDEAVQREILFDVAKQVAHRRKQDLAKKWALAEKAFEALRAKLILEAAKNKLEKKFSKAHYPAPFAILRVLEKSLYQADYKVEREEFARLVLTPQAVNLIKVFQEDRALKNDNEKFVNDSHPQEISKVGIVGAGLMGAGIAYISAYQAGSWVRLKDVSESKLRDGLKKIYQMFRHQLHAKKINEFQMERKFNLILPTTNYTGFKTCPLVIEAVFEDEVLKKEVLQEVEAKTSDLAIFASNTSTIPIANLSEGCLRPQRIVAMHYFSPVEKMPLLELVRTETTDRNVLATCINFGMRQGKKVVVVNDGCGFFTSRVLAFFLNEAFYLLRDGYSVEDIDKAVEQIGFPMGPFKVIDEVGLEVTNEISEIISDYYSDRFEAPLCLEPLIDEGWNGERSGQGFYSYRRGERKGVNTGVYEALGISKQKKAGDLNHLAENCFLQFISEAICCLGEGILESARDGDLASIYGLGFPPFLGGPFRYVDQVGLREVRFRLEHLVSRGFTRFTVPDLLNQKIADSEFFYEDSRGLYLEMKAQGPLQKAG